MRLSPGEAIDRLNAAKDKRFLELFTHGTLAVEVYAPVGADPQQPHTRDEVYVIIHGTALFFDGSTRHRVGPGDFLFVAAGMAHRFEEFSDGFATWVLFYGAEGGETPSPLPPATLR